MKKLFLLISLLIVASMILAACQPAATPTEPPPPEVEETEPPEPEPVETEEEMMLPDLGGREVTIAVENAYLPFNYVTLETGEAGGWDYDFIDEACARLNCVPVWIEFGWDTMIASVAEGLFDMATDGITITDERAETVDFSDTHGEGYALATAALSYGRQVYEGDSYSLYGGLLCPEKDCPCGDDDDDCDDDDCDDDDNDWGCGDDDDGWWWGSWD